MYASSVIAALFVSSTAPQLVSSLSVSEAATLRKGTYGQALAECAALPNTLTRTLLVPEAVRKVYAIKPAATVDLLLRIADGGSPSDSIVAASYVLELSGRPGAGLAYVHLYNWNTYDQTDPDFKVTLRDYVVRAARNSYLKWVGGK